jgi:2-polyprenyl-3-methyl-5-hydroxy-6-metoxy-1,4-benzoquinol methylase
MRDLPTAAVGRMPPRGLDLARSAESFDAIAGADDWYYAGIGAERRDRVVDLLDRCVPPGRPGRALDLGCGAGFWSRELAHRGWSVTAIDSSPRAIDAARQAVLPSEGSCEYLVGDWRELLGEQPCDLVLAVGEIVSYVEDIGDFSARCVGSLSEGGRVVGTTISLAEALSRAAEQGMSAPDLGISPTGALLYWERTPWEYPDTPIAAVGRPPIDIQAAFDAFRLTDLRPIGRKVALTEEGERMARKYAPPTSEATGRAAIFGYGMVL